VTAPTLTVDQAEYIALCAQVCRLRDYLLKLAQACEACAGTGWVTLHCGALPELDAEAQVCGDCLEVREVLG
jgi:hypothetical protein